MTAITSKFLQSLRAACEQIEESQVTVSLGGAVITFDFRSNDHVLAHVLNYETQPTREQLLAMLSANPQPAICNLQ